MSEDTFSRRRGRTDGIVEKLTDVLRRELADGYETHIGDHTCVYATGSCGRGEMGEGSDLDAYVVRVDAEEMADEGAIQKAVRVANEELRLPELDGGGKYLKTVRASAVLDLLGMPEDDGEGVLTKRMLLLLESRVLLGQPAHRVLVGKVIDAYWRNASLHPNDYLPIVLVNDIVRYWRIVLLNHESRLRKRKQELSEKQELTPEVQKAWLLAERRYRSYKLRLPRCLTCFSALTYLLALTPTESSHVSKEQMHEMVGLSPVDRLLALPELVQRDLPRVAKLLSVYGRYLERTDVLKANLLEQLRDDVEVAQAISREGREFTQLMFELVQKLGGGRSLHRHMLV